ncbi:kinase-like protein [Apiospora saccharicola]
MEPVADFDLGEYLKERTFPKSNDECHERDSPLRHRDIKPENILIHGKNVLLADFRTSFSSGMDTRYTHTDTPVIKRYLAPEADNKCRVGRKGDIFSLGCVFLEMTQVMTSPVLYNQKAFPEVRDTFAARVGAEFFNSLLLVEEHQQLRKRIPEQFGFHDAWLNPLLRLIIQMLDLEPDCRPKAEQIIESLSPILEKSGLAAMSCCSSHPEGVIEDAEPSPVADAIEPERYITSGKIMDSPGGPYDVNMILDTGAHSNFMSSDIVSGCDLKPRELPSDRSFVHGVGSFTSEQVVTMRFCTEYLNIQDVHFFVVPTSSMIHLEVVIGLDIIIKYIDNGGTPRQSR